MPNFRIVTYLVYYKQFPSFYKTTISTFFFNDISHLDLFECINFRELRQLFYPPNLEFLHERYIELICNLHTELSLFLIFQCIHFDILQHPPLKPITNRIVLKNIVFQ